MTLIKIPTIYADGECDDLPGIVAALENRPVIYKGVLYAPGQTMIITHHKKPGLTLSKCLQILSPGIELLEDPFGGQPFVIARQPKGGRHVTISYNTIVIRPSH